MFSNLTTIVVLLAALAAIAFYSTPEEKAPCCSNKVHQNPFGETVYCPVRGR